jgi:LysM repeat protein
MATRVFEELGAQLDELGVDGTTQLIAAMRATLFATAPRFYCWASGGFGHQASTIALLKRFIELGVIQNAQLVYKNPEILEKLRTLLPQIPPGNDPPPIQVESGGHVAVVTLTQCPVEEKDALQPPQLLGISGGWDVREPVDIHKVADLLNVSCMVTLQPFTWEQQSEFFDFAYFRVTKTLIRLGDRVRSLSRMPYYRPRPAVGEREWALLEELPNMRQRIRAMRAIVSGVQETRALFSCAYGISNVSGGVGRQAPPAATLFNVCAGARVLQARVRSPVVVLLMVPIKPVSWTMLKGWVRGQNLPNGQQIAALVRDYVCPAGQQTIFVREDLVDADAILAEIRGLAANQVLILNIPGTIPVDVFDLFVAMSTLPCIFEGAGTLTVAASQGVPYFRVRFDINYPALPGGQLSAAGRRAQSMVETAISDQNSWEAQNPIPAMALAEYFGDCLRDDSEVHQYFTELARYLLADPGHDKLLRAFAFLMCLREFTHVDLALPPSFAVQSGDGVLDQLYAALEANTKDGVVNVVPGAIGTGPIADLFRSACVGGGLSIEEPTILPPENGRLVVTGSTDSIPLLTGASVVLTFTDGDVGLSASLRAIRDDLSWNLSSAPWFALRKPLVALAQVGQYDPPSGTVGSTIALGDTSIDVALTLPAPLGQWVFTADFSGVQPSISSFFQLIGGINLGMLLPPPLNAFGDLAVQQFQIMYDTNTGAIGFFSLTVGTTQSWPLFGNIVLGGLTINTLVTNPADARTRATQFDIAASFPVGAGTMKVTAKVPGLAFSGVLLPPVDPDETVGIADVVQLFLPKGYTVPITGDVTELGFNYNQPIKSWAVSCAVQTEWPVPPAPATPWFTITDLGFSVSGASASTAASFTGGVVILPKSAKIGLTVSASYETASGWTFRGEQTSGVIELGDMLHEYFGWNTGGNLGIDGLGLTITTKDSSWVLTAKTARPWTVDFAGLSVTAKATVGYNGTEKGALTLPELAGTSAAIELAAREGDKVPGAFARIETDWKWEGIDLKVWAAYDSKEKQFGVTWGMLQGVVQGPINTEGDYTATLSFTDDVTLGSMVETMISWITGQKFGLDAPWNILDSIKLSALALVYTFNPSKSGRANVSFKVNIGPIDLGIARIDSIGIAYQRTGPQRGVNVTLNGSFPWLAAEDPAADTSTLGWDASKPGTAPAPPGSGSKYFDLRLLAMGQHVTVQGITEADTVQKAIALLETMPIPDPGKVPIVTFDSKSSWLIGADFGILKLGGNGNGNGTSNGKAHAGTSLIGAPSAPAKYFISCQTVFNDPRLYALRLALDGGPAKIFKGLDFQIMYRQVSETVGVYQTEITLPDAMRNLSVGVYSLTLPVFGISVYTNGDFLLDIGFPWNADFARSFTIQGIIYPGIPVIGSAGFYFGKLSSATTDKVPKTTNGSFNPVIVFGFGMQIGFGKYIQYGVLSAGFSVTVVGILEGVIAKFNPLHGDDSGDRTQVQGAYYFALQGTTGIIGKLFGSIDLSIIKAEVNVELKLLVQLSYESFVSISITVLVSVEVSVSVKINLGIFTINLHFSFSMRLKETFTLKSSGTAPWHVAAGTEARGVLRAGAERRLRAFRTPRRTALVPQWSNLLAADTPAPLAGYVVPALTVARDEWSTTPVLTDQLPCYVGMMFIDSVPPASEDSLSIALEAAGAAADTSFERLCKMVLRWAIAAAETGQRTAQQVDDLVVSDATLQQLLDDGLTSTTTNPTPIPPSAIDAFLSAQFTFTAQLPPNERGQADTTFFPVPPALTLTIPAYGSSYPGATYAFGGYNAIDAGALGALRTYFADLAVQVSKEMPSATPRAAPLPVDTTLSVAAWVYADYFLLIARQMVQAAREALRDFKYPIASGQTVHDIVHWIATRTGLGADGYTRYDLFAANTTHQLNTGKTLTIGLSHVVKEDEPQTLTTIAATLGGPITATTLAAANAADPAILRQGTTITYPGKPDHPVQTGDTLIGIAGIFGVSFSDLLIGAQLLDDPDLLAPKSALLVPAVTYQTLAGDTFTSIAALPAYAAGFTAAALATQNAASSVLRAGAKVTYGAKAPYVVRPGDCLADVALALGASLGDLLASGTVLTQDDLIAPASVLALPPFPYTTVKGDTLGQITSRFGITIAPLGDQPANDGIVDLFDVTDAAGKATPYLDAPHLPQFRVGDLIDEAQRSLAIQHLSGMASRYHLHGLRLPTTGITPSVAGMWVHDVNGVLTLPPFAGLYALTGQQFPVPAIGASAPFTFTFDRTAGPAWLLFTSGGAQTNTLTVSIASGSTDATRIANVVAYVQGSRIDIGLEQLGAEAMYTSKAATYPLSTSIAWQTTSAVPLPYGPPPAGVQTLRIWNFPATLINLPNPETRALDPRFAPQVARYDEATGATVSSPLGSYGWATTISFRVKRVPDVASSAAAPATYEIVGAGGNDIVLLERLLEQVRGDDAAYAQVIVGYAPDQVGSAPQGVQTDPAARVTMGIAQTNLSTETHPFAGQVGDVRAAVPAVRLLNTPSAFVQLLWEASITRSGGFYLYYYDADASRGLPDRIFNESGEATLNLILIYSAPAAVAAQNCIASYMNGIVTGDGIDTNDAVVVVEADPLEDPPLTIPSSADASLDSIAYRYYSDVGDLAEDNAGLALGTAVPVVVDQGVYQAPPGGIALATIAQQFGTTVQALQDANPRWGGNLPDPLPFPAAVRLPVLALTAGTSAHTASLGDISGWYGENLAALAARNRKVSGIFATGQTVTIPGGPRVRAATVAPGVEAVEAIRSAPPPIPIDPTVAGFAEAFIENTFSLLNYQVAGNADFDASKMGLPAGPTTESADPTNVDKIRTPMRAADVTEWEYRQAMPYAKFTRPPIVEGRGLPDQSGNPYRGVGRVLQVAFDWQDYYGNTLLTTLSDPQPGDTGPFNQPPMLTGYTDPIIGLARWPSVSSSWRVMTGNEGDPALVLALGFDSSRYQGVMSASAPTATSIAIVFTQPLDATSAENAGKYAVANMTDGSSTVTVQSAVVSADGLTVTLTVTPALATGDEYTVTVTDVATAAGGTSVSGHATFGNPDALAARASTVQENAARDRDIYESLYYQLTDPNGIAYAIESTLLEGTGGAPGRRPLTAAEVRALHAWLFDAGAAVGATSIYSFLADRAAFGTSVAPPAACTIVADLGGVTLNPAQIFELALSFRIARTGGAVLGDLETTAGIRDVATRVAPFQASVGLASDGVTPSPTLGLRQFAIDLEQALSVPDAYQLKVATGIDRARASSPDGSAPLWVVRVGATTAEPISYAITPDTLNDPAVFAPRPISTELQSRTHVPIFDYATGTGISKTPSRYADFSAIDMDLWGRQLFTAVDRLLTPQYTAAIQIVGTLTGTDYLQRVLEQKKALAAVAKQWMIPAFADDATPAAVAQEAFYQQLLVRLSNAYAVRAAVQYAAEVNATVHDPHAARPPRLFGEIQSAGAAFQGVTVSPDALTTVYVQFSEPMDPASAGNAANYAVSDGIRVSAATLSADGAVATLTLSGAVTIGDTTVTVDAAVKDAKGAPLCPPLEQPVTQGLIVQPRGTVAFTSPKLSLETAERSPITFLVVAPDTASGDAVLDGAAYLGLNLSYAGSAIEHQIAPPDAQGYQASSWLTFVVEDEASPLTAHLGQCQLPMMLRVFPTSPTMVAQGGAGTPGQTAADVSSLIRWDYTLTYSLPFHYPQDRVYATVEFNVASTANTMDQGPDVFPALAEFTTVVGGIQSDFDTMLATIDATTNAVADKQKIDDSAVALASFIALLGDIASVGANGLVAAPRGRPYAGTRKLTYHFYVQEGAIDIGATAGALLVTMVGALPDGIGAPRLLVDPDRYDCIPYTPPGGASPDCFAFVYQKKGAGPAAYLSAADGQTIADRTVVLPAMDILQRQDAWTALQITRNEELVPGKPSAPAFVYTTPLVQFANPLHPTIDRDDAICIADITPSAPGSGPATRSLQAHLDALFGALLHDDREPTLTFQVSVGYDYPLNPGLTAIPLPVMMQAPLGVTVRGTGAGTLAQMIADWTGAIALFFTTHEPLGGGTLWLDLSIMSNLTVQPMPLLRLRRLYLPLEYIEPPLATQEPVVAPMAGSGGWE